jgi:hypothetical protein
MKSLGEYVRLLENIEAGQMNEAVGPYTVRSLIQALSKFDPDMRVQMSMNMEYQSEVESVTQEGDYVLISD